MTQFSEKVYQLLKKVPRGRVTTYKEIAYALGTKACQAVGQALRKNPYSPIVPCHRVVTNKGTIGGFKGETQGKAIETKKKLLLKEGVKFKKNKIKNFKRILFKF